MQPSVAEIEVPSTSCPRETRLLEETLIRREFQLVTHGRGRRPRLHCAHQSFPNSALKSRTAPRVSGSSCRQTPTHSRWLSPARLRPLLQYPREPALGPFSPFRS